MGSTVLHFVLLTQIFTTALASMELEVEIVSFSNPNSKLKSGSCCNGAEGSRGRCPLTCRTFFTACAYGSGGSCQNSHYTNLQSGIMGNSTFSSFGSDAGKREFIIHGSSRNNIENGLTLDVEALNRNPATSNLSLIGEFRLFFGEVASELNAWSRTKRSEVQYPGGLVTLEIRVKLSCSPNFYGPTCSKKCVDEPEFNLVCDENGNEICAPGFKGIYCDEPVCDNPCVNGDCAGPNTCICFPGFTGKTCAECIPLTGCKHGYCNNNQPHTCACDIGWGGPLCDIDLEFCTRKRPCENGGKCSSSSDPDLQYQCQCPVGFSGRNCEQASSCSAPGYCKNDGICLNQNSEICLCPKEWTGPRCDVRVTCDVIGCQNGANCEKTITSNEAFCVCPKGFVGDFCELKDPCSSSDDNEPVCKNGGLCHVDKNGDAKCRCARNFLGDKCEIEASDISCEENPCHNNGRCVKFSNGVRCNCAPGFTGRFCSVRKNPCLKNPCNELDGSDIAPHTFSEDSTEDTKGEIVEDKPELEYTVDEIEKKDGVISDGSAKSADLDTSIGLNLAVNIPQSTSQSSPLQIFFFCVVVLLTFATIIALYFLCKRVCSGDCFLCPDTNKPFQTGVRVINPAQNFQFHQNNIEPSCDHVSKQHDKNDDPNTFCIQMQLNSNHPVKCSNIDKNQFRDFRNNRNSGVPDKWMTASIEHNDVMHHLPDQAEESKYLKTMRKVPSYRHLTPKETSVTFDPVKNKTSRSLESVCVDNKYKSTNF